MPQSNCENCGVSLTSTVYCPSCQTLQKQALELDYYSLFDLAPAVEVDLEKIKMKYLKLCRDTHPDFNPQASALAESLTSRLNEAYQTLQEEKPRYEYLNQLWGGQTSEEDKSTPQDFLIEMLELQENVEDCQDINQLNHHQKEAGTRLQDALERASELLKKKELSEVRKELNMVNYCHTLLSYIEQRKKHLLERTP